MKKASKSNEGDFIPRWGLRFEEYDNSFKDMFKRQEERRTKKEKRISNIILLRKKGFKRKEIAKAVGISCVRLDEMIRKYKIPKRKATKRRIPTGEIFEMKGDVLKEEIDSFYSSVAVIE